MNWMMMFNIWMLMIGRSAVFRIAPNGWVYILVAIYTAKLNLKYKT